MTPEQLGLLILAGGRSVRFGDSDKLLADVNGMPLGLRTAERLVDLPWASRTAVTSGPLGEPLSKLGFQVVPAVENGGMGDNLASGVRSLPAVEAVLILLADMPFVSAAHINRLVAAATSSACIVASKSKSEVMPPVIFGKNHFEDLVQLSGESGARKIINDKRVQAIFIEVAPEELVDIDTREALASAIARFKN
jgi:molybdenum cofactor cytidylyltransferase